MAEYPTDKELTVLDGLTGAVAARLAQGRPRAEIISQVTAAGWDQPAALTLVETVENALAGSAEQGGTRRHGRRVLAGLALAAVGVVVLLVAGGGVGPIVAGVAAVGVGCVWTAWGGLGWLGSSL